MFSADCNLQNLESSSILLFNESLNKLDESVMQPVILIVIIITTDHANEAVACPKKGVCIKAQNNDLPR